jgi:hypothetical protein
MEEYQHWLEIVMHDVEANIVFQPLDHARHFTRFNREIGIIAAGIRDAKMAKAISSLYGSECGYLCDVSKLPACEEIDDFFDSVLILYSDLFESKCTQFYSHLDRGPERANPLNGPCYMLWDFDCGIDSFRYSGIPSHLDRSIQLLSQLIQSRHPATIESAIHGLGHMIDEFRQRCLPPLESVLLRSDIPEELKDYANQAIHYYIQ